MAISSKTYFRNNDSGKDTVYHYEITMTGNESAKIALFILKILSNIHYNCLHESHNDFSITTFADLKIELIQ